MANFEQREGSGILFTNSRKKNDKAPDYQGSAKLNGVEHEIAGWVKQGKNGDFISLSIKPKGQKSIIPGAIPKPQVPMTGLKKSDMDDEIPF